MNYGKLILMGIVLCATGLFSHAQSLSPEVISVAGGKKQNKDKKKLNMDPKRQQKKTTAEKKLILGGFAFDKGETQHRTKRR